eukprot:5255085-Pyramimonas_sp.AAC.1
MQRPVGVESHFRSRREAMRVLREPSCGRARCLQGARRGPACAFQPALLLARMPRQEHPDGSKDCMAML